MQPPPLLVRVLGKMVCAGKIFELGTFLGPPTTQGLVEKTLEIDIVIEKYFTPAVFGALRDPSRRLSESGLGPFSTPTHPKNPFWRFP